MTHEAVLGLQIRYASFSDILTNMKNKKNYLCIMNHSLQIRYVLLQVQLLLQYNTDSYIKKLAKLRRCLSRVLFGIHFGKYNVLNVFRSCYLNRRVCNFFPFFLAELDYSKNLLFCSGKIIVIAFVQGDMSYTTVIWCNLSELHDKGKHFSSP